MSRRTSPRPAKNQFFACYSKSLVLESTSDYSQVIELWTPAAARSNTALQFVHASATQLWCSSQCTPATPEEVAPAKHTQIRQRGAVHSAPWCSSLHGGQRDGEKHDADRNNVHRQTDNESNCQRTLWRDAARWLKRGDIVGKIKWVCGGRAKRALNYQLIMEVRDAWECCRRGYVQTRCMNESRVSSCEWQETETWFCVLCVLHVRTTDS